MGKRKRAPAIIYWPIWAKQWLIEGILRLWELAQICSFLYLFVVMLVFFCWVWAEQGFWAGLIVGNIIGLIVALVFGLGGFAILLCLSLGIEVLLAPFYCIANHFEWRLPELPGATRNLRDRLEVERRFKQTCEPDRADDKDSEIQRLKNRNSLLKFGLALFGIDLLFNHFGDDE